MMRLQVDDDVCHQNNWSNVWNGNWIRKSIHEINEINLLRKVICEHNSSFEEAKEKNAHIFFFVSHKWMRVCGEQEIGWDWRQRKREREKESKNDGRKNKKDAEKRKMWREISSAPEFHWAMKYNSNQLIRWRRDPTELMIMNIECV